MHGRKKKRQAYQRILLIGPPKDMFGVLERIEIVLSFHYTGHVNSGGGNPESGSAKVFPNCVASNFAEALRENAQKSLASLRRIKGDVREAAGAAQIAQSGPW